MLKMHFFNFFLEWVAVVDRWTQGEGNEGAYGRCIFVSIYENRRMKPVEIILSRG
jgi:hypothetical protein